MHCIVGLLLLIAGLATAAPLQPAQQTNLLATDNSIVASSRPFNLQNLKSDIEAKLANFTQTGSEYIDASAELRAALIEHNAALKAKVAAAAGKDQALKNTITQIWKDVEKKFLAEADVHHHSILALTDVGYALTQAIIKMEAEVINDVNGLLQLPANQIAQPDAPQPLSLQQSPPQPESNSLGATVQPAQQQGS